MISRRIFVLIIFCALTLVAIEARRLLLRPIPTAELHRILRQSGREDAVPEGRVISQSIAAVKGFALGFKKGVIGLAIIDGLAALSGNSSSNIFGSSSSNSTSSSAFNKASVSYNGTSNEICFTSRSAASDIVASGESRASDDLKNTPTTTTGRLSMTGTTSPTTDITGTGTRAGSNTVTRTLSTTQEDEPVVNCISLNKT